MASVSQIIDNECPKDVVVNYSSKYNYYSFKNKEIGLRCEQSSESMIDLLAALHEVGHSNDKSIIANIILNIPKLFNIFTSPLTLGVFGILCLAGVDLFYILPLLSLGSYFTFMIEFNADRYVLINVDKYGIPNKFGILLLFTNSFIYLLTHLVFQVYFLMQICDI